MVSGPIQLTGLAVCETSDGGMTIRTGKGGRYRYYTCSTAARMGKSVCPGRTLRMDELDALVADTVSRRVLGGDHPHRILAGFLGRDAAAEEARRDRLTERRRELSEAEDGARRLLRLVESGLADVKDPLLRKRVA